MQHFRWRASVLLQLLACGTIKSHISFVPCLDPLRSSPELIGDGDAEAVEGGG
jgi:hypothetical protein